MLGFSCILLYGRQKVSFCNCGSFYDSAPAYALQPSLLCTFDFIHVQMYEFTGHLTFHLLQLPCVYSGPSCLVVIHTEQPEQAGLEIYYGHNVCHFTFQKLRNLSSCCQYATMLFVMKNTFFSLILSNVCDSIVYFLTFAF